MPGNGADRCAADFAMTTDAGRCPATVAGMTNLVRLRCAIARRRPLSAVTETSGQHPAAGGLPRTRTTVKCRNHALQRKGRDMATYNELEQRVLRYLEKKLHERRGAPTRAKQGVKKAEIMRDCSLNEADYSATIGRLEADRIVSTVARNAVGEFVNIDNAIIQLVRSLESPSPTQADSNITLDEFADSGLYGAVWRGKQLKPARQVAIKIVNPEYGMTFDALAHANGLVKAGPHPNIVTIYQVTKVKHPKTRDVVEAVIMEWLDGESLANRIASSRLLTAIEATAICNGLVNGIAHLHSGGVSHSDLHEGNVLLTLQGPRIIDIDYSRERSLSLLTTLGQAARIQADVVQLARIIGLVIARTDIEQAYYNSNEKTLRAAATVEDVRSFVDRVFANPKPLQNADHASPSTGNLASEIESAIESHYRIGLRRLVIGAAKSIASDLASDKFPPSGPVGRDELRECAARYKATIGPLIPALGVLGYWGGKLPNALAVEAIDMLANAHEKNPLQGGIVAHLELRRYPVASALYAAGIGAVARGNYRGLFAALRDTAFYEHGVAKRRLWDELARWNKETRGFWNSLLGRDMYFPVSQMLEDELRDGLAELLPSHLRYVELFDRFETFASLDHFLSKGRALGVSFLWRRNRVDPDRDWLGEIRDEAESEGEEWKPLKAGILKGTGKTDILKVLDEFSDSVNEVAATYGAR
jgi:tRNA A-37 threonylcarbamoyl transferase component Bud32